MKRRDFISSSSPSDILRKLHQLGLHSDVLKLAYPDFQLILSAAYEVLEGNLPTDTATLGRGCLQSGTLHRIHRNSPGGRQIPREWS
jgi:hypothetical protein